MLVTQMQTALFWVGIICDMLPVFLLVLFILHQRERGRFTAFVCCVFVAWVIVDVCTMAYPSGPQAMDVRESMRAFASYRDFTLLWDNSFSTLGFHWLPIYVINTVTNSLFGERVMGMLYQGVLILGVALLFPQRGRDTMLVMVALCPSIMYLSRNYGGCDILIMQLIVCYALWQLGQAERLSFPLAALAGIAVALTAYDYIPSRVMLIYPLLFLWRKPVGWVAVTYAAAAVVLSPLVILPWLRGASVMTALINTTGETPTTFYGMPSLAGVLASLRPFVFYGGLDGTYSVRGGQVLPWMFLAILAYAVLRNPVRTVGWLGVAAVSLLPDVINFQASGRSHRQMMVVLPLLFAVKDSPVPRVLTVALGVECIARWVWLCHHIGSAFGTLTP